MPKVLFIAKLTLFLMAFPLKAYIFLTIRIISFRHFYLLQVNRLRKLSFPQSSTNCTLHGDSLGLFFN